MARMSDFPKHIESLMGLFVLYFFRRSVPPYFTR